MANIPLIFREKQVSSKNKKDHYNAECHEES
jgi:hypothetical protein